MTRFEFSNYKQLTKLDKSEYNALKKGIFSILQNLGKHGTSTPVAYDTAWAARVPQFDNLALPAFPQCLKWLRDHQREDGSWGDDYPPSVHSKVLNTFTAVLALSQWKHQEDEERTRKGVNAIWRLSEQLPRKKTECLTFEMILSALVDDARAFGLDIPYEHYEWFATIGRDAVQQIQRSLITNKPNQCWAILEAAGRTLDIHPIYYRSEIKCHGLIAAQSSTTAYILRAARLRGEDFIEAGWVLEQLSLENDGGLPHLHFCDNFDLIHSLDLLTKAGINPSRNDKHVSAKNAIDRLKRRWNPENGIGFSSTWLFADCNCTEAAGNVVKTLDKQEDDCVTKRGKEIGNCITNPQLKSSLIETRTDQSSDLIYLEQLSPKLTLYSCKIRNVSKYYSIMRSVFEASTGNTNHLDLQNICDEIARSQNSDGGWGGYGTSSVEETAYICVTILELIRHSSEILYTIDFSQLVKFIQNTKADSKSESIWNWKVSFSSRGVSKASIVAAKYAVFQMQRICILTDALNDYQLDFDRVAISESTDRVIFQGHCLRFQGRVQNTEDRKKVTDNLMMVFDERDGLSSYVKRNLQVYVDFSYAAYPFDLSVEHRTIDIVGILFLFLIDDTIDLFDLDRDDVADRLNEFSRTAIAILEDGTPDLAVPVFDAPGFSDFSKFLFYLRDYVKENGWDRKHYIKELTLYFNVNNFVRKDLQNKIEPTVKRYLQIHKISTALRFLVQQNCMIVGIADSESEKPGLYTSFLDYACKACRLWADFPSVLKDAELDTLDNYCLRLQHQYKVSVQKAIQMAVKKSNKEILKMYALKKILRSDPKYSKRADLPLRMKYVETYVDGTLVWSFLTDRYKSKWTNKITEIPYDKKDVTFVRNLCFDF